MKTKAKRKKRIVNSVILWFVVVVISLVFMLYVAASIYNYYNCPGY